MHPEAMEWVQRWAPGGPIVGLDIGGRNINGAATDAFHPDSTWEVVDLHPGDRVTWVGDFVDYEASGMFDVICHVEVAEHALDWPMHLGISRDLLDVDGVLIFTAAGPGRAPHSALDGGGLRPDEHYENVQPAHLAQVLDRSFSRHVVDVTGTDVRAAAWR